VGGGLSGLATAVALLSVPDGPSVELWERRAVLGGRAASSPGEHGEPVDNCQHVLMGCCTSLWDFYGRLGVRERIRWVRRLNFLDREGGLSTISGARLPAPLHLLPSLLQFGALGAGEKLAIARAMAVIARTSPEAAAALEAMPFSDWLRRMRQPPKAVSRFWRVVLVSALNEELARASTTAAFQIFRDGFLRHPRGYTVGIPTVPLGQLYEAPIARCFAAARSPRSAAGRLCLRMGARELVVEGGVVRGVRAADGTMAEAEHVVAAVPFDALAKLLPERWIGSEHGGEGPALLRNLARLSHSPITAVHLWFDRPVTSLDHAVLLDRPVQWMFNKTIDYGLDPERESYLGLVTSASREWLPVPSGEILGVVRREVEEAFPGAREARLVRSAVVKEAKATFSVAPGVEALRPACRSPIRNLWLAGDWTQTGWPATMEGAVRSGYRCAEEIMAALGRPTRFVAPDGVIDMEHCDAEDAVSEPAVV
jgi:squalene-associated FAD-dependent desaturase